MTVNELCAYDFIDAVMTRTKEAIGGKETIVLGDEQINTVLLDNKQVLLVSDDPGMNGEKIWRTLTKQQIKEFDTIH